VRKSGFLSITPFQPEEEIIGCQIWIFYRQEIRLHDKIKVDIGFPVVLQGGVKQQQPDSGGIDDVQGAPEDGRELL
jgi:hypothetical protein